MKTDQDQQHQDALEQALTAAGLPFLCWVRGGVCRLFWEQARAIGPWRFVDPAQALAVVRGVRPGVPCRDAWERLSKLGTLP